MFNANNLVLHDADVLQEVREFPVEFWLGVLAVVLVTYFFHSFAVWRLMNRVGVKGFFLAFLPFMRFFAYNRLGKEVGGWGPKVKLLYRFLSLVYLVGIFLMLMAPNFTPMVVGIDLVVVCHLASLYSLVGVSAGICGKPRVLWFIPFIGSLAMLVTIFKSRHGMVYIKSKNYDGLFKKVDDMEIVL